MRLWQLVWTGCAIAGCLGESGSEQVGAEQSRAGENEDVVGDWYNKGEIPTSGTHELHFTPCEFAFHFTDWVAGASIRGTYEIAGGEHPVFRFAEVDRREARSWTSSQVVAVPMPPLSSELAFRVTDRDPGGEVTEFILDELPPPFFGPWRRRTWRHAADGTAAACMQTYRRQACERASYERANVSCESAEMLGTYAGDRRGFPTRVYDGAGEAYFQMVLDETQDSFGSESVPMGLHVALQTDRPGAYGLAVSVFLESASGTVPEATPCAARFQPAEPIDRYHGQELTWLWDDHWGDDTRIVTIRVIDLGGRAECAPWVLKVEPGF